MLVFCLWSRQETVVADGGETPSVDEKTLASVSFIDTASEGLNFEGPAGFRENLYAILTELEQL